jgi:hypothetical protein
VRETEVADRNTALAVFDGLGFIRALAFAKESETTASQSWPVGGRFLQSSIYATRGTSLKD